MSQERQQEANGSPMINEESFDSYFYRRPKFTSFRDVVLEVMKLRAYKHYFEPIIRRVIREEFQLAFNNQTGMQRNPEEEIQPAGPSPRSLQLRFLNTISLPLFSASRIKAEGGNMRVALIDALTGEVVSNGPISSAKVEIVVLDGDFNDNVGDSWTQEKFGSNIVRAREGKKALLNGDVVLKLKEGFGELGNISITDNSSWTRSHKFRLGARVLDNSGEIRVKEAKTGPFVVRDQRGEHNKKHYPPSLSDEVWRLEKIGKTGVFHRRMNEERINTVKDFLILLYQDPTRLRNILSTGMSDKMWEVTVRHARTCVLDKRVNVYCPRAHENNGVVLNVVGQVTGLLRDGQYVLVDKLSEAEKADARNLVTLAFKHWEEVVTLDDETSLQAESSLLPNVNYPSNWAMAGSSDGINNSTLDDVGNLDYPELYASPSAVMSPIFSMGNNNTMDEFGLQDMDFLYEDMDFLYEDMDILGTTCSFENPSCGIHAGLPSAVNECVQDHPMETVAINKAHLRWRKIFCVLRWLSVRRTIARKSMLQKQAFQSGQ